MWKLTLACNVFLLFMVWFLCQIIVAPTYNLFVQYTETEVALPILTNFAFRIQRVTIILPLVWLVFTMAFGYKQRYVADDIRNERISFHTSLSLCIGLLMILFFLVAGILPLLKIGAFLD